MLRPEGFPHLSIAPAALADKLRRALPQWVMGLEEPGLARFLALRALSLDDADLRACGAGLALWGWQRAPLDRQRLELMIQIRPDSPHGVFAQALLPLLTLPPLADGSAPAPEELAALAAAEDVSLILRLALPRLREPASSLAWLAPMWDGLLRHGSAELPRAALSACPWPRPLMPLRLRLEAEAGLLYDEPDAALSALDALDAGDAHGLFAAWSAHARAELLLRREQADEALALRAQLFAALPWHTHLGLMLHDALVPPPVADAKAVADAVILVYSWNKAELVRQTLHSLSRTDLGGARIIALDNGSTDGTGEAMRESAALFAPGALRVISLPVNIGAPGARNWLLAQPEVQAAGHAVFLDDDVLLPPRWLARLIGAAKAADGGRGGVAGCRIVAASPPPCLQSADYQLFAPSGQARTFHDLPENVNIFDNCAGALDFGLYNYARPAAHVSGCCHALPMDAVRELGGFDIRFSPTQFDDLERDLRGAVAGRAAAYAGDIRVAHVQHSSLAKAKGPAAMGQVFGNKVKLEGLFTQEDMARAHARGLERLWDDTLAKWETLGARPG